MPLEATVMCTCFARGEVSAPPVPRGMVQPNEEGYLTLSIPPEADPALLEEFLCWRQSCCGHPDMVLARTAIGNSISRILFLEALSRAGWEHFPTLREELHASGAWQMPSARAQQMQEELERFEALEEIGQNTCLVDSDTSEVVYDHLADYEGAFKWGEGVMFGLDQVGFFIRDRQSGTDLFHARRFRQTPQDGEVEFEDLESGRKCVCLTPLRPQAANLRVETRDITPSDFDSVLSALRRTLRASVETCNPVRWRAEW